MRGPTVMVNLLKLNGYVGRVSEAPPGNILGMEPDVLPGGGGDCYRFTTFSDSVGRVRRSRHPAICWPRKRWPDSSVSLGERARGRGSNAVWSFMLSVASAHIALPVNFSALCFLWRRERTGGGQSPPPPVPPGSGQQNRRCAVPSTYPCRLRVGPRQRPCKTRPSARIHAGCPGLPGTSQRF